MTDGSTPTPRVFPLESPVDPVPDPDAPVHEHLPPERPGITRYVVIGGEQVYITVNEADGRPTEVFIRIGKSGDELRSYEITSIAISLGLQYGIPWEVYAGKFRYTKMEPAGVTSDPDIPMCSSVADYLAQLLERKYGDDPR